RRLRARPREGAPGRSRSRARGTAMPPRRVGAAQAAKYAHASPDDVGRAVAQSRRRQDSSIAAGRLAPLTMNLLTGLPSSDASRLCSQPYPLLRKALDGTPQGVKPTVTIFLPSDRLTSGCRLSLLRR